MCCLLCCECILNTIYAIVAFVINALINLVIIVCSVSFIVWIMLRHNAVKFQIHDAQLSQFDLDPNDSNLHYNLSLTFSIRNSNARLGVHYDRFETSVYYDGQRLAAKSVPAFYQGSKSTVEIGEVFQGQNLVLLGEKGRRRFEDERRSGVYGVDVVVRLRARLMFGIVNTWRFKPRVKCGVNLLLQSSSNSTGGFLFQPTDCGVHF